MANIEQQLSTGKTIFVLTVVAGCFAVLWPKIFYPMFFGSNQYVSNLDKAHEQMRQERPPHMRPEMLHPALRENGRAIPREHIVPRVEPDVPPKVIKQPGVPKPGMPRPSFGAAPHPKQASGGIMNLLMPMYTISIVAFFIYTMLRFLSNNQAQEPEQLQRTSSLEDYSSKYYPQPTESFTQKKIADVSAEKPAPKLGWKEQDAKDLEIDQLRRRLEETEAAMEKIVNQMLIMPQHTLAKVGYQTDSTNEAAKLIEESSKVPKIDVCSEEVKYDSRSNQQNSDSPKLKEIVTATTPTDENKTNKEEEKEEEEEDYEVEYEDDDEEEVEDEEEEQSEDEEDIKKKVNLTKYSKEIDIGSETEGEEEGDDVEYEVEEGDDEELSDEEEGIIEYDDEEEVEEDEEEEDSQEKKKVK